MKDLDWKLLINKRRSARSFFDDDIEVEKIERLKKFINEIEVPFEHSVEVKFFKANQNKNLYTMFNSPRDNMAFISETDYVSISKAGFIGELAVLYATSLGLATCWFGHYTLTELERLMPHLGMYKEDKNPKWGYGKGPVDGRRVVCITPLAYYKKQGLRVIDRMQLKTMSFKRKPINEIINKSFEELPTYLRQSLDMARKAPSGGNSQSWRINISDDNKTIKISMEVGYKHLKWEHPNVDIGICAAHFYLGLLSHNLNFSINTYEDQKRAVWKFEILE